MPLTDFRYYSEALGMQTAATIILPDPSIEPPYPVMFLLHGLSDDHTIWLRRTSLERYLEGSPWIVVMPNGGRGFYTDAHQGFAFGSAIGEELPRLIERYLPTRPKWAVTGLSMGGYGAVRLALRYPDRFVSAVSHSGALDFGHTLERWDPADPRYPEFSRIVGPEPEKHGHSLYSLASHLPKAQRPALRIDCGTEDFLIESNRHFHEFLDRTGFAHEYEEFPGDHNWGYWDEHVQEAIAFNARQLGI